LSARFGHVDGEEHAMNEEHLQLCASPEWAEIVETQIIPWTLDGLDLGDDLIEIGPGPGRTTDVLRTRVARLTAVEIDPALAAALATRMAGTNVEVVQGDATQVDLPEGRFSAAVCITMLHHVPTVAQQDALFARMARLVRPGGVIAGVDSVDSPAFRELHHDDICNPVDPATLADRLQRAGMTAAEVEVNEFAVRFRVRFRAQPAA
jgi:SAM-dependent methyltransferase